MASLTIVIYVRNMFIVKAIESDSQTKARLSANSRILSLLSG